jgi:hypothetical protein
MTFVSSPASQGHEELIIAIESDGMIPRSQLEAVAARFFRFDSVRFSIRREFPRTQTGTQKIKRVLLRKLVFEDLMEQQVSSGAGKVAT